MKCCRSKTAKKIGADFHGTQHSWREAESGQARYFLSCDRKVTEMRQARCYRRLAKAHRSGYFSAMNPILFVEKVKTGEIE